jgi:ABC-type branched-subunit amino acid transport system substrate-binding protein
MESMMIRIGKRLAVATAAVSILAIALTGCGRADDGGNGNNADQAKSSPGITDTTIKLGGSFPLSGPLSRNGQTQLAATKAYIDEVNDAGGVKMGDGKTRTIDFVYYDDAYDPARLVQNFRRLVDQDQVFGTFGMFGTASNLAAMPVANDLKVPQVYLGTGAAVFSQDRKANPYTVGWWPTYQTEASTFGKYLVSLDKPLKVAFLAQNDDQGDAYLEGLKASIEGSKVTLVKEARFAPTDTVYDSQVSSLAATGADALFSGVNVPPAQSRVLEKLGELQWHPTTYLPIVSAARSVVTAAKAGDFLPQLYSGAFTKDPCDAQFENDDDVVQYKKVMKQRDPKVDVCFINTIFGWGMADSMVKTLEQTKAPNRESFMQAIQGMTDENIDLVLDDLSFNGGDVTLPPISHVVVRHFENGDWKKVSVG